MMRAKEILTLRHTDLGLLPAKHVDANMPVVNVLPLLLDSREQRVSVTEGGRVVGVIDRDSLLEGIGHMIAARDDCSVITLQCAPRDYCASELARAVEDSDAHLVDLWSAPGNDGKLRVTLRVRRDDPSATVHSLERYGYDVTDVYGAEYRDSEEVATRLLELRTFMNV